MTKAEEIMDRVRSVQVVNSQTVALQLSQTLRAMPKDKERDVFAGDMTTGFFWLVTDAAKQPDMVMECVVSPQGDAITSTYSAHPIFGSVGELMRTRRLLIEALSEQLGLSNDLIGVEDPGRGRRLGTHELGTGQLIDLLAEQMGTSVATTSSYGGDLDNAKVLM